MITDAQLDAFHRIGAKPGKDYGEAPMKKLSMLLRPAFIAPKGRTLVWGDFANIEARVLPWLANSRGGEAKLDIFRATDRDPVNNPDVYCRTAADLLEMDASEFWSIYNDKTHELFEKMKDARQSHGKVPELSLGFGGGLGALQAMARNYSVFLSDKVAMEVVVKWREANRWVATFWGKRNRNESYGIWGAVNSAIENPDTIQAVGRVAYAYDKSYLGGTLFCALPCGRLLTYPDIKWAWREVTDKKTGVVEDKYQLTYIKGYSRSASWYGKKAENITQAGAASVLRHCLKRIEFGRGPYADERPDDVEIVMHTHDEIVLECDEDNVEAAARYLKKEMELVLPWMEGLPVAADITSSWFYSKNAEGMHL